MLCHALLHPIPYEGSELLCAIRQVTARASQVFWPQSLGPHRGLGTAHVSADLVMWQLGANSSGIAGTVCSSQHCISPLP